MNIMDFHAAIHWKTNNAEHVVISGSEITEWNESLGLPPTDEQIQEWITEYQAWKVTDDAAKADAASVEALIEKKKREQAIASLESDGLLLDGKLTDVAKMQTVKKVVG